MHRSDLPYSSVSLLLPPYERFTNLGEVQNCSDRGVAVVWTIRDVVGLEAELAWLRQRPCGVALVIVLPPPETARRILPLLRDVSVLRPRGVLPHGGSETIETIRLLLSSAPRDLPVAVVGHFADRGVLRNPNIRALVSRIVELAPTVPSITQLARKLYTSRRTLGRHFEAEGLPVPSHWLQFARLLSVAALIQERQDLPIFRAACSVGYPDGFTMSNQMKRLIGCRPSDVRAHLGLSWIIEEWIWRERQAGRMKWPGMYDRIEDVDEWLRRSPFRRSA